MPITTKNPVRAPQSIQIDPGTGDATPHTCHTGRAEFVQFTALNPCVLKFSNKTVFGTTTVSLKKGDNPLKLSDPNPPSELKTTYTVHKPTAKVSLTTKVASLKTEVSVAAVPGPHEIVVP